MNLREIQSEAERIDWTSRDYNRKKRKQHGQSDYDVIKKRMLEELDNEYVGEIDECERTQRVAGSTTRRKTMAARRSRPKMDSGIAGMKSEMMGENGPVAEWSGEESPFLEGFDLEVWWVKSSMLTRLNVILLVLCLTFGILYLIAGIWYISKHFRQTIKSPYVCETEECHQASRWLTSNMNWSQDPCEDFQEFMCGNYHHEEENTKEGRLLRELINTPVFKVEFGANSILAKMLHNFQNNPVSDQSIRFYQACLNEPMRKKFGFEAFFDTVEKIFGTRDFSKFESSSLSLEQIGANMLTYTGDAGFINMAFYTYPYIVILRPTKTIEGLNAKKHYEEELIDRIFENLLPLLGVTDPQQIADASSGVYFLNSIEITIENTLVVQKSPKRLTPTIAATFEALLKDGFHLLCPPFGLQLNLRKMFSLFIGEEFRYEFYDLLAFKYFVGFEICFSVDPETNEHYELDNPKLAFVAPWLFSLFWDFLLSMDTRDIMAAWNISVHDLPDSTLIRLKDSQADQHIELRCMLDMGKNMGYLPVMQFLMSTENYPLDYLEAKREEIRQLYAETVEWFKSIPDSEIEPNEEALGRQIFGRGIYVDVIMPLVSGMLDESAGMDSLNFSQDHLRNSFIAVKYTVEHARNNWLGSTNTAPTLKWWGSGSAGKYDAQSELFDIRRALIRSAEFDENLLLPANQHHGQWQKFLGRPQPNYLFYFLTIFDEPYTEETLAFKTSGISLKILRSIYSLLSEPRTERYSTYFHSRKDLVFMGYALETRNRSCSVIIPQRYENKTLRFEYNLDHTVNTGIFSWIIHDIYHNLLTLKQSFQLLKKRRKLLSSQKFSWHMEDVTRKQVLQRLLPGPLLEKYSEEHLFFMAFVRNACRGSWKTHFDELREDRYFLEKAILNVLMQMEEFAKVWKCKKKAFMSNLGYPRCVQWVPK